MWNNAETLQYNNEQIIKTENVFPSNCGLTCAAQLISCTLDADNTCGWKTFTHPLRNIQRI